jgi:predicted AlkP superfamily phosphohydrolase/phosphomutase
MILSDHGFAPWYRAFHLNTWLLDHGYITLRDPTRQGESEFFLNVDWTRTRAYGLGLNGLYINQLGREPYGMVSASDLPALLEEIRQGLLEVRDPANDQPVVSRVYESAEVFSGEGLELAPDLIVGFHRGYRNSNESSVGRMPPELIVDNLDRWSGDHCIAADLVPGILLTNRSLATAEPRLMDLAATILKEFEITPDASMESRALW